MRFLLFNKPYQVLCQFTDSQHAESAHNNNETLRQNLSDFIDMPGYYAAGRLDYLSEGLLILTNDGAFQHRITDPANKMQKSYWVQVEGTPSVQSIKELANGVTLRDGKTLPAKLELIDAPKIWQRSPAVTPHRDANSQWINMSIHEGKNRQIRRMLAHVGHPVLRLVRHQIGPWSIENLTPGQHSLSSVNLPKSQATAPSKRSTAATKPRVKQWQKQKTKPTNTSKRSKLKP